MNILKIHR